MYASSRRTPVTSPEPPPRGNAVPPVSPWPRPWPPVTRVRLRTHGGDRVQSRPASLVKAFRPLAGPSREVYILGQRI